MSWKLIFISARHREKFQFDASGVLACGTFYDQSMRYGGTYYARFMLKVVAL
jgi:hypothetical protein